MINEILNTSTNRFRDGEHLEPENAASLLDSMIASEDESQLADLLTAWNEKGVAGDEIYALAAVMRDRCLKINSPYETFVDIVGTGGSSSKTFNVSTAAAFVIAGAGVPVAKHGNKAASSKSGSADVLAALGVRPDVTPAVAEECLRRLGVCFMFAPNYHRLSPVLAAARRRVGKPTVFNCLGPLCNPASVPVQVIGVWDKGLIDPMAQALTKLGTFRSWVVHAESGLDEISLEGITLVAEVSGRDITRFQVTPANFGIEERSVDDWRPGTAQESAEIVLGILGGGKAYEEIQDLVVMNAGAAIYLAGRSESPLQAAALARESIRSGMALGKLTELSAATN